MEKPDEIYERKVMYYETDRMRIVHHSNYIRWFEEARLYYMEKRGLPYEKMEENGVMIPVLSVDCRYHVPVKFGQTVLILCRITLFTGTKLGVEYEVRDKESGTLHVTGHSEHCFVDAEHFRPLSLTRKHPEMAEIFITNNTEQTKGSC